MSTSPLILVPDAPPREEWIVLAHKQGKWTLMHPKHFPVCGSRNEALDRVRIRLGQDREFRLRWHGHQFLAVRFDDMVMNR